MIEITDVLTGAKARKKILNGVNRVYNATKLTLGPEGKNALLPRTFNRGPRITNDGITIAELARQTKDEHEQLAAEAFVEGAKKTNQLAGDGTTTTQVLAGHLINKILKEKEDETPEISLVSGKSKNKGTRALRREILEAKDLVIEEIKKQAKPIKTLADLEKIAVISIGKEDEGIAKTVARLVWDIGRGEDGSFIDNHVDVTEGYKGEVEVEIIRGMRFPAKVPHKNFVNKPERFELVAEDVPVLITNHKIDNAILFAQMMNALQLPKVAVFAPDFSVGTLNTIIKASENGVIIFPIKCPSLRTEQMEDLAAYTDAKVVNKEKGQRLELINKQDLGFAEKIVVKDTENREDAVLLGGKGEKTRVAERITVLKQQLKESRNDMTTMSLEKRIANLSSAVGIIRVGSSTQGEGLFLKLKIEDGVYACKAALQEGYVEGGGLCLKKIAEKLPENILTETLKEPNAQILKNAGGELSIGKDVIDPAKVVRLEVEHGVSIASILITTDISIPAVREKSPAEGYEMVARAINNLAFYFGKHHSLIKENEDLNEEERNKVFEQVMAQDND